MAGLFYKCFQNSTPKCPLIEVSRKDHDIESYRYYFPKSKDFLNGFWIFRGENCFFKTEKYVYWIVI